MNDDYTPPASVIEAVREDLTLAEQEATGEYSYLLVVDRIEVRTWAEDGSLSDVIGYLRFEAKP